MPPASLDIEWQFNAELQADGLKTRDIFFMQQAFKLACYAKSLQEVPIGAVVVEGQKIIGYGYNQPITQHDPTAHAEIIAIRMAAQYKENYRLSGCELFVTLEPCLMCAGSLLHARLQRVVFGAGDSRHGALGSQLHVNDFNEFNWKVAVESGVMQPECQMLLKQFFHQKRLEAASKKGCVS